MVGVAHTFVEVWEGAAALLAEMDVLLGFAEVAVNAPTPYVRPIMLPADDGELKLVGCRSALYKKITVSPVPAQMLHVCGPQRVSLSRTALYSSVCDM